MKIHLGAGTIYLKNYINVDIAPHYIVPDVPLEILAQNSTTVSNYYKHEFCKGSGFCVADVQSNLEKLPFNNGQAEEVILIQVLEHIPNYNLGTVLNEINHILRIGGCFRVGVPDIKKIAKLLAKTIDNEEEDWFIRLLYGTQRNMWSHHHCGYTERTLKQTLSMYGFGNFEVMPNINFYPSVHIKAFKNIEVLK